MQSKTFALDPRYFQIIFQLFFLSYGILWLGWNTNWIQYSTMIAGALLFNYAAECARQKKILSLSLFNVWGLSVLISALSLCLLLKTNHWYTGMLAALFTVISKYIFRFNDRHIFNPSAFGIVATLLITDDAWLSPGQWGTDAIVFFSVVTLGTIVVTRVQKLDTSLAFLFTYAGLLYWRQIIVLGWPMDYFIHSVSTGSLLLFTFFMISDPKTSPDHPAARVFWAMLMAAASFYFSAFQWKQNTPVWVLVLAAPVVPILNKIFRSGAFQWNHAPIHLHIFSKFKQSTMRTATKKMAAMLVLVSMLTHEASAFCGFYVSKADGTLKNKTSQVIIVHDGDRNVITMYNDFHGNMKDFAMVVPVPVVLKKSDIKVVDQQIFTTLNEYSKPRLVEYYDQNPCEMIEYEKKEMSASRALDEVVVSGYGAKSKNNLGVKIEAKYLVGEYDILILSAKESSGLQEWLTENGYKIPAGANEVLEPYIKSNLKFFVVKVNENEQQKLASDFLRPIQISFRSPKFMLPIRLGMANADGDQDMIVYAFTKMGRIECTNYRTVSLPTGKNVPLFVQNNFANFYSNLFQHQWNIDGRSVAMLEYAWDVSPQNYLKCDPCVAAAPSTKDLVQSGVWWLQRNWDDYDDDDQYNNDYSPHVFFTRIHVRYNRSAFPQDLVFEQTANSENFQARYIITHPANGDFNCEAGRKYLQLLKERRKEELQMLTALTGKTYSDWDVVASADEEKNIPGESSYKSAALEATKPGKKGTGFLFAVMGAMGIASLISLKRKREL
jgi:Na+-translocating ferredoxin:NAD+ oxidoreductase RnfD subunit